MERFYFRIFTLTILLCGKNYATRHGISLLSLTHNRIENKSTTKATSNQAKATPAVLFKLELIK